MWYLIRKSSFKGWHFYKAKKDGRGRSVAESAVELFAPAATGIRMRISIGIFYGNHSLYFLGLDFFSRGVLHPPATKEIPS